VDGVASAREIVRTTLLPSEETQKSLLGLLSTGVIEYAAAVEHPPEAPPPEPASPPSAPVPFAPPPAEPEPAAPPPEPGDEKSAERRREILEAWEGLKSRSHFEVLGLSRSVGEAEVKEAYFRLAKRFHPDVHHGASLGDLRDELEAVFIGLGEAYDVLRDPRRRADYEERLGRPRPKATVPGATPATAPDPPRDPEEEARLAEEAVRTAARLVEQERYWDAIQKLEPAVEAAQGKTRLRARVLLARCYIKNPKWARSAEAELLAATREEPRAVEPWALLGAIYAGKGLRTRATAMYRKVLELRPDHEEAVSYLGPSPPPPAPREGERGGGLLGRLFRRG
jgi:tetratricopeptide (TPR) repeat protein